MGILIAIEGVDGSGKETQTKLLGENLKKRGYDIEVIRFPDYDAKSSVLVKMYLMGEFSKDPKAVDAYQASTFFAADRYASWMTGSWREHYLSGGIILADRYTTANMVHQAGKIKDLSKRDDFLDWLYDFEFRLYGIPVPDLVFFLDVPPQYQKQIVTSRKNKITGGETQDIHESSPQHLQDSYEAAAYVATKYGWVTIDCAREDKLRSIQDIGREVLNHAVDRIEDIRQGTIRPAGQEKRSK